MCESCLQENQAVEFATFVDSQLSRSKFVDSINSIAEHLNIL